MSLRKNRITLLGTGTSTGVPMVGCQCRICLSTDSRDQRTRVSAWLQTQGGQSILIDATPDLRQQALKAQIRQVDGCIVTHDHADHTHGLDDLRPFCFFPKTHSIPIFTSHECSLSLKQRFPYIFRRDELFHEKRPILGGGIPLLDLHLIEFQRPQSLLGEDFYFFELPHGHIKTAGIFHQGMAYLTDCKLIPPMALKWLKKQKLQVLIIDCVKFVPHQTHLHFDLALEYIWELRPERAFLIHMSHDMGHQELTDHCLKAQLPYTHALPAYDGLTVEY